MMQRSSTNSRWRRRPLLGRLSQAYFSLLLAPENIDGLRAVSVARHGAYEVRLVERFDRARADFSSLWVKLYRRDIASLLDSRRCEDLDHAEMLAKHLLLRAKQLGSAHA
jgi:hypothetical protein